MSYVLSCCSTADLTKEHFERRGIHYICFHYQLDGKDMPPVQDLAFWDSRAWARRTLALAKELT